MLRILVLYDIPSDRIRAHVADACLDYGLERIQYSAFVGELGRAHRQELKLRIERLLDHEPAKIRFIPLDDIAWRQQIIIERAMPGDEQARQMSERREEAPTDDTGWPA
ncbi:MAG: CRISPR-associated endonuclease Cas2 [Ktedonobacterales bacterium]